MTHTEFDLWIEDHYAQLVSVARRLVNDPEAAREVVHDAVARTLAGHARVRSPWVFMVNAVRSCASNRRRTADRLAALSSGIRSLSSTQRRNA